jgi:hypothetical protein
VGGFYDEEMRCNEATWKEGKNAAALGGIESERWPVGRGRGGNGARISQGFGT